jgi:hypothetical protein
MLIREAKKEVNKKTEEEGSWRIVDTKEAKKEVLRRPVNNNNRSSQQYTNIARE